MHNITIINQFFDEMKRWYKNNPGFYIYDEERLKDRLIYDYEDWSEITDFFLNIEFAIMNLSESKLNLFIQEIMMETKEKFPYQSLIDSSLYGYFAFWYVNTVGNCINSHIIEKLDVKMDIDFPEITRYLAQIQICGWDDKANEIGRDILNAFNEYDVDSDMELLVTTRGQKINSISWFIIDLYTEYSESWYIKANVEHTPKKKYQSYQNVLDNWQTEDMLELEKMIYMLCEYHLDKRHDKMIAKRNMDDILGGSIDNAIDTITKISEEGSREDWTSRELDTDDDFPILLVYPYEVIYWLKLRELKGLKNPKTFTHPLMNTPIAKMFLNIKEPLPYPKELPYAKELLEKLKEQCPDVEIPEWLKGGESDGLDRKEAEINKQNNAKGDDIIPDDFFAK